MTNRTQWEQDANDYADPLCVFLGGDPVALRVARRLRRYGIQDIDHLREEFGWGFAPGDICGVQRVRITNSPVVRNRAY